MTEANRTSIACEITLLLVKTLGDIFWIGRIRAEKLKGQSVGAGKAD